MSATLNGPRPEELTSKERVFYDHMLKRIPDPERYVRVNNIGLVFQIPKDFTREEFARVGHCLTRLYWDWEEMGKPGTRRWAYVLLPCGIS